MLHFESGEEYDTVFNIDLFVIQSEFVNIYIYIYIFTIYICTVCMYVYICFTISITIPVASRISEPRFSKQFRSSVSLQRPQAVLLALWQRASTLGLETAPGRDLPVLLWSLVPWRVRIGGRWQKSVDDTSHQCDVM